MKLLYWNERKNFGDQLNPWLWPQLLPGVFDESSDRLFLGIGTILNKSFLPEATQRTVIFGSGVGYGEVPCIDESWKIYCVRGPLTAARLCLPYRLSVTDSAILVRRVYRNDLKPRVRFSYMPHHNNAIRASAAWEHLCQRLEFGYIDPRDPVPQILDALSRTEILITDAMHGAIVADALRVPWIAAKTCDRDYLPFKWLDWCSSVGVEYAPFSLIRLSDAKNMLVNSAALKVEHPLSKGRRYLELSIAAHQLLWASRFVRPKLSADRTVERLTTEVDDRLHQLRQDLVARA